MCVESFFLHHSHQYNPATLITTSSAKKTSSRSVFPSSNMEESQPTVGTANIFEPELECYNSIAHTPSKTFDAIRTFHKELEELLEVTRERDYPVIRDV